MNPLIRKLALLWGLGLLPCLLGAQSLSDSLDFSTPAQKAFTVSGYLKDLQAIQILGRQEPWILTNLVHNRLDFHYYADSSWKFHLGIRNRLYYGDTTAIALVGPSLQDGGDQLVKLSHTFTKGPSYLLNSTIDRASVDYTRGKWEVTAGRQRINWGLNLVWNPNDIFNAYSYFDFDYEERPGSDALRLQYYASSTNSAEIAYKPSVGKQGATLAGLYRFTRGGYDFQVLAGWMKTDYVLGGGWSGALGKAGFNGELTTFMPKKTSALDPFAVAASVGVNYTFSSSLYLHGAYLLNSAGATHSDSTQPNLLLATVSAKNLSAARHSIFLEGAYQFSPLLRGDLAAIIEPADGSVFAGPFLTLSLTNTLEMLAGGQLFFGNKTSLYGNYGQAIYLRLKWSF